MPAVRHNLELYLLIAGALIFVVSQVYDPVFSGNQNGYFVHGLSNIGGNNLANDFLAGVIDHAPVFSAIVTVVSSVLPPVSYQLLLALMLGIYYFSVIGIVQHLYEPFRKVQMLAVLITVFIFLQSPFFLNLVPGLVEGLVRDSLREGLASQRALDSVFESSTAGVIFFLAILAFIGSRYRTASLLLIVPVVIQPSYLTMSTFLLLGFAVVLWRRDQIRVARTVISITGAGLLLVAGYLLWAYLQSSPEVNTEAARILVRERIPHHALPQVWFGRNDEVQLVVVALAWFLVRRTALGSVIGIGVILALVMTGVQMATGSNTIALLFPWRITVVFVPLSSVIIMAFAVNFALSRIAPAQSLNGRMLRYSLISVAVVVAMSTIVYGVVETQDRGSAARDKPHDRVAEYVANSYQPGFNLMIPPARTSTLSDFRLDSMVPIYVDQKAHPIFGAGVVEWYRRLNVAQDVVRATAWGSVRSGDGPARRR